MPTQPWCNETSWVYLGSSGDAEGEEEDCDDAQDEISCLRLQFTIMPFQVSLFCLSASMVKKWNSHLLMGPISSVFPKKGETPTARRCNESHVGYLGCTFTDQNIGHVASSRVRNESATVLVRRSERNMLAST